MPTPPSQRDCKARRSTARSDTDDCPTSDAPGLYREKLLPIARGFAVLPIAAPVLLSRDPMLRSEIIPTTSTTRRS